MWATLALTTALGLTPAQAATKIQFKNTRITYGLLGQERKSDKFQPGDEYIVTSDVEGLTVKGDGQIAYSWSMQLLGPDGKSKFTSDPQNVTAFNTLGGGRIVFTTRTEIGLDTTEGEYTLKVTIKDRLAKGTPGELIRKFTVTKPFLGFARPNFQTTDGKAFIPAPPVGVPGQTLLIDFLIVGFSLDKTTEQPHLITELQILDSAGKAVHPKPITGVTKEVAKEYRKVLPNSFPLELNRAGDFKIHLKVTDKKTNKTAELVLDLKVLDLK